MTPAKCRVCQAIHPYHTPVPVAEHLMVRARAIAAMPWGERTRQFEELAHSIGITSRSLHRYLRAGKTKAASPAARDHYCGWQGCPTILSDPYQLLCRYHQKQP